MPRPIALRGAGGPSSLRLSGLLGALGAGLLIALAPQPAAISRLAQFVLAILAASVILWATRAINPAITSILMMGLMIMARIPVPRALSGFADPAFWTLLAVLFYGFAMTKTGLAERISYYILAIFPGTYMGILSAFFLIGVLLTLGIPSMTVRTAIMAPIAWALVQSLGLAPRSRGAALILLTTVEMAVVPGIAFLYGSLAGPVVANSFAAKHINLTWWGYARVTTVPTLLLCGLILFGNQLILRPERPINAPSSFARQRLRAIGAFSRSELVTAVVVTLSIAFWITRPLHLPAFLVGMLALPVFAIFGIVEDGDLAAGVSWQLLLFLGGIFSLANVLGDYKITDWLTGLVLPRVGVLLGAPLLLIFVLALGMFAFRFIDPSSFIAIAVLFQALVDITSRAGIPPLVAMASLLLASVPFWMLYQNFWVAMSVGLTDDRAFTNGQMLRLANGYAVFVLITLGLSEVYWKMIHVL
jgi:DASS family divalent anion:Na+ symporter